MSLLRRREMLKSASGSTPDVWAIDWDYSMGNPDGYGLKARLVGNGTISFSSETGQRLRVNHTWYQYVYLEPNPKLTATNKCTIECSFNLISAGGNDGLKAVVQTTDGVFQYAFSTLGVHTARIERVANYNKVYYDGTLVYSGTRTDTPGNHVGDHICLFGQNSMEAYVTSYKISVS